MHSFVAGLCVSFLMLTGLSICAHAQDNTERAPATPAAKTAGKVSSPPEREPIPDDAQLGVVERSIIRVDDAQRAASEGFGDFVGQLDGFFSNDGSDVDSVSNNSYARIRFDLERARGKDFELDPAIKLRVVLPRTERKLKLLLSTDDEDEAENGEVLNVTAQSDQNASLALRFIRTAREDVDVNFELGLRQRDGDLQFFGRVNTRYRPDWSRKWKTNIGNSYYYFVKSGFRNRLSFDFRRLLYSRNDLYFRTYTDFNWQRGRKGAVISHTSGFYMQLAANKAIAFEGLAGYSTSLNEEITDRFSGHEFRIRWRDSLGRPWLFYEIWPSVAWPSDTDYRRTLGILLRLEFIIGQRS